MKPKAPNIETILILIMSAGLFVTSLPSIIHLTLLNFPYHSQFLEQINVLSNLLVTYGLALLVIAILSYICSLNGSTLVSQLNKQHTEILSELRKAVILSIQYCFDSENGTIWLFLALVIGAGLRGYFLFQPMRYDEAYTFLNFVNQDLSHLFFYPLPNNHVLHSILAKASTLIWGVHPASIRMTAFLAGVGLIPLIFCLCRTLKQSGVFASISAAVFPYLILYSTNARGYSLLVFLTLGLALIGAQTAKKISVSGAMIFSSIAALGMFTIPSMLFPIASIYCWLACLLIIMGHPHKTILYKFVIPSGLMTIAFTIILYTPVIFVSNGIESIVANRFVQSQPWQEFLSQICSHFQETFSDFSRDIPKTILLTGIMLVIIGIYSSVKKREWAILLILPSILFASIIVFLAKHKIPFPRTWIYVIPFILLVADSGFTYIIEKVQHKIQLFSKVTAFIVGAVIAVSLISTNKITNYPDTGTFPEAQIVAKYLKSVMTTNDRIVVRVPADWPTYFYLWYYGVPEFKTETNPESRKEFFIVQKSRCSIMDMTDKPVINLLNSGDMALYQAVVIEYQ